MLLWQNISRLDLLSFFLKPSFFLILRQLFPKERAIPILWAVRVISKQEMDWMMGSRPGGLASVGAARKPEIQRIWCMKELVPGCRLLLGLLKETGSKTLKNLQENSRCAVSMADPQSYASLQLKGRAKVVQTSMSSAEVERWLDAVELRFQGIGLPKGSAEQMLSASQHPREWMWIDMTVDTVFDQSPKPGAGARIP